MKGFTNFLWIAIVAVVVIGVYLAGGFGNLFLQAPPGNYLLDPQYGTYSCENTGVFKNENAVAVFHPSSFFEGSFFDSYMVCPGNTKTCTFGVRLKCSAFLGCTFTGGYEFKNINDVSKGWVTMGNQVLGSGEERTVWFTGTQLTGEAIYIKVYSTQSHPMFGAIEYNRYQLVQRAANGYTAIANPDGCQRPTLKTPIAGGDSITPELCVSGCVNNIAGNVVPFDDFWNYLGGYNIVPSEQLNIDPTDGEIVYCQPVGSTSLVKTLKTITTDRTTYYIPDQVKRSVECCPFQSLGASQCQDDFTWAQTPICTDGACDIYGTINSCPGTGSWIIDLSDPRRQTLMRATGCDSSDCCIMETTTVECTSSSQCVDPSKPICKNYVCISSGIDPFLPDCGNGICEAGENDPNHAYYCPQDCAATPTCGDGTCDQGESPANCPDDCPLDGGNMDWIWIPIFALMFGAIGYFKKEIIGATIGGIAGLVVGILVYGFLSMALWQQIGLVALFGAAGIALGYVIILAIPLIIAVIIALR